MTHSSERDLSVVIIAFNEEANLTRCLQSLPQGVEIILLDSDSTDRTADVARSFGAKVYQRAFTNFAEQKNAAIAYATRSWILALDADEELDPVLASLIVQTIQMAPRDITAFSLPRKLVFMGRRMRFGKTQDRPIRLFQRGQARYEGSIHEELKLQQGQLGRLRSGCLWHHSYRDLSDYFVRFNRYTTAIAERHVREGRTAPLLGHVFRPWFEFLTRYVVRLGFLDGYPGYTYALISSLYAYVKYAKLRELKAVADVR
ncbi:MAG: glycosyltransferase family 2 protein [Oligoflexus sp.]|jgi:glycosyltransferase involved in cell wall biosynthesis